MTDRMKKFRDAAMEGLRESTSEHASLAMEMVNDPDWGGRVGNYDNEDYIVLKNPYERGDTLIFDDKFNGVSVRKLTSTVLAVARLIHESDVRHRITTGNLSLVGRVQNMMSHLYNMPVTVRPSETKEGRVNLNGWGEFDEDGSKAVFESLKAADAVITKRVEK